MTSWYIILLVVLLTEAAVVGLHVTWASPWWRRPFLWSDRWHVLSALSHWPAVLALLWWAGTPWWGWLLAGGLSSVVWAGVKRAAGKPWPVWWVQAWRWWGAS